MQEWILVCGHALDYGLFYKLEEKLGTDYSACETIYVVSKEKSYTQQCNY